MQGRGEEVVEFVQIAGPQHGVPVEEAGELLPLAHGLGHHGGQEHSRVDQPIEASADGVTSCGQVQR